MMKKVLLISMPWAHAREPSLAIGILKSVLTQNGIPCDVLDVPFRLLRWISIDTYDVFSTTPSFGVNDFLFTHEFEPHIASSQLNLLRRICRDDFGLVENYYKKLVPPEAEMDTLIHMRQSLVPRMLGELAAEIDGSQYAYIGFTCQYDQIWSSLALAHRLKALCPSVMVVFGGASVADPVGEYLQSKYPDLDVVAYGDGEPVVAPLFQAACGELQLADVPNISYRDPGGGIRRRLVQCTCDLAHSPAPDYDARFRQATQLKEERGIDLQLGELPVESSRGCWWGQKCHCRFCGTEKRRQRYRCKPAATVIHQLDQLYDRYRIASFRFNENIMPRSSAKEFWPRLVERGRPYKIHYEMKSNQSAGDIDLYARGGAFFLQPGIESFSTPVLERMNKGVSGIQNVFTIHMLMQKDIYCFYNIIFGMPEDREHEYLELLRTIPCLYHLIPPGGLTWPFVARYSPLAEEIAASPDGPGLKEHWRYQVLFSPSYLQEKGLELNQCVHYFNYPSNGQCDRLRQAYECLQHQVIHWRERYYQRRGQLSYAVHEDSMRVTDTRITEQGRTMEFDTVHAWVYTALKDRISTRATVHETLAEKGIGRRQIDEILDELCHARVVLREGDRFVGLAFAEDYYKRPRWWIDKEVVRNGRK